MINIAEIQGLFFEKIKEKLNDNLSLVHEVSEALQISYDSTYRRLRGEKKITLDEAITLSNVFKISIDELTQTNEHFLSFNCYPVEPEKFCGRDWLNYVLENVSRINAAPNAQIVYAAKDPPIFQYFEFPEIAVFKFFFWEKTLFRAKDLTDKKLSLAKVDAEIAQKCKKISTLSMKVPTTEIWNEDTFRILMRQIEYYWVSGYFETKDDILLLLSKIEQWLKHNKLQAEIGMRFPFGSEPKGIEGSYVLYENEIVLNDNTIFITMGDSCVTYLTYNVLGLLASTNKNFCKSMASFHKAIMSKSNLISQVGEKERNRFFNKLNKIVDDFKVNHL